MKVLITGATGLIGSALYKHLLNQHKIVVLTRTPSKAYLCLGHRLEAVSSLSEIDFNEIEIVVNLAGEPIVEKRWNKAQKKRIYESRIELTRALSDAILHAEHPPHTFISGSAVGYYGRQADKAVDETCADCYDEFSHQLCKDWEQAALRARSTRTRVCLLRTGIVLANQGGALTKMLPPYRYGLGGPLGNGRQYMSWIHLDDMVQLILFLIKTPGIEGPVNATAPNAVTNQEFSQTLADVLKRPNLLRMPASVLRLMMGEMADLLLYGQHVLPKKAQEAGFRFRHPELRPALEHLLHSHHSD